MVLHGLYDTLLKKEMGGLALVAALASVGWMAFQFELMVRKDRSAETKQSRQVQLSTYNSQQSSD